MTERKGDGDGGETTSKGAEQADGGPAKLRADETRSGQEATNDAPRDHPQEHQSNYGGGGANGGA